MNPTAPRFDNKLALKSIRTLTRPGQQEQGFIMIATLMLLTVFTALLGTYFSITSMETSTNQAYQDSASGFYAAEAGLNIRAEQIRATFVGFNRPSGTSPLPTGPCQGTNLGTADFACQTMTIGRRQSMTFAKDETASPVPNITIPAGELYEKLSAQEYQYLVTSEGRGVAPDRRKEAILDLRFKTRLVPLFQFAAFYNKDLEILPGRSFILNGPVHTNGDLYIETSGPGVDITGQVTTAGSLYRGRKNANSCASGPIRVFDRTSLRRLLPSPWTCPTSSRTVMPKTSLTQFNGLIQVEVDPLTLPPPEDFDPINGKEYWTKADLRLVLSVTGSGVGSVTTTAAAPTGIEVKNSDWTTNTDWTQKLHNTAICPGTLGSSRVIEATSSFYNNREGKSIRMLDVDIQGLLNCIHRQSFFALDESTEGGVVIYLTINGPDSNSTANAYGVRLRNGASLVSTVGGAPKTKGLSIISDQAAYTLGNYNSIAADKIPAAIMADSINVLSAGWLTSSTSGTTCSNALGDAKTNNTGARRTTLNCRPAADTTIHAAFLGGTDTTGDIEGSGGHGGAYNGGLENYMRFHENWGAGPRMMTYVGSFVSLNRSRHVTGSWASQLYSVPERNFSYDTSFNSAENLPPITPRFVYLRQQLFQRDWDQG